MINSTSKYGTPRRYRSRLRAHNGFPHCVAFIDLFFLLLLFAALASQVVRISGIKVELPQVEAPEETILGKLIVSVTPAGYDGECQIYYRDRAVTLDELRQIFSQESDRQNKTVVIRADSKVPSGVLNELISAIHGAKMAVLIAVQTPNARPEMRFE